MKNNTHRNHRFVIAAALTVALSLGVPASSWGYWSASATPAPVVIRSAIVPVPTGFACASSGGVLGLGSTANYSWAALPSTDLPPQSEWRYVVHLRSANGSINEPLSQAGQTSTSVNIGSGLLSGLLGGLLELLLGGQQVYVSVSAMHPSGWQSAKTDEIPMRRATILGGITC